jgi:hypothetical protein
MKAQQPGGRARNGDRRRTVNAFHKRYEELKASEGTSYAKIGGAYVITIY